MSVQITCTNQVIRLILAYGPQENASKDEKDKFYDDLNIENRTSQTLWGASIDCRGPECKTWASNYKE